MRTLLIGLILLMAGCAEMPSDYRLADVERFKMWSDIQRATVVCIDGGGYAQIKRDEGDSEVAVWCFARQGE